MDDYELLKQLAKGGQGTTHVVCRSTPRRWTSCARRACCSVRLPAALLASTVPHAGALRTPRAAGSNAVAAAVRWCVSWCCTLFLVRASVACVQAKKKSTSSRLVVKQTQCENVRTGNDALREAKTLQVRASLRYRSAWWPSRAHGRPGGKVRRVPPGGKSTPRAARLERAMEGRRNIDWTDRTGNTTEPRILLAADNAGAETPLGGRVSRRLSALRRRLPCRLHRHGALQ